MKTVMVSGGFDPVHVGHLRMFEEAKKLGDRLIVVINNDNWLHAKKSYNFMEEGDRKELIQAFECVDEAVLTKHDPNCTDMSVCQALEELRPDVFANGGDRKSHNTPEDSVCAEINCKMVFGIGGGKVQSSSWLLRDYLHKHK